MNPLSTKTATVIDHAQTGARFRVKRERRRISLYALGQRLNLSPSFISDLERGRRNWTASLADRFEKALNGKESRK